MTTMFTKDFLIGASTAAHQVEGNNTNSDYWAMEQNGIFQLCGAVTGGGRSL